jgi:hypothetical protein
MDKLKHSIGLAPSEMEREELLQKLQAELERMNFVVDNLAPVRRKKSSTARKGKKRKMLSKSEIEKIADLAGVDLKELLK